MFRQDLNWTGAIGGVQVCEQYDGSGKEQYDFTPGQLRSSAQRTFKCHWSDRYAVINNYVYQPHPNIVGIYSSTFDITGCGKSGVTANDYAYANIRVGYNNFSFDPTNYKEVKYKTNIEIVGADKSGMTFSNGKNPTENPQVLLTTISCEITLHNQPLFNNAAACEGIFGQINSAAFKPDKGRTWAAGHVLYHGYDETIKYMVGGQILYDITHNLTYCQYDWRYRFNPDTGAYEILNNVVGGKSLYNLGDFSVLAIPA